MKLEKKEKNFQQDLIEMEMDSLFLYELLDDKKDVIFVGTGPLKSMLSEHLPNGIFPIDDAKYYRTFSSGSPELLSIQKKRLLRDYKEILGDYPLYNKL